MSPRGCIEPETANTTPNICAVIDSDGDNCRTPNSCLRRLTFEVTRGRRWDAWPAWRIVHLGAARARWPAAGPRVDRGVRPHWGRSELIAAVPSGMAQRRRVSLWRRVPCAPPKRVGSGAGRTARDDEAGKRIRRPDIPVPKRYGLDRRQNHNLNRPKADFVAGGGSRVRSDAAATSKALVSFAAAEALECQWGRS